MVGWWASGKLRPTQGPEFCAFPALVPDGADGAATGLYSWRSHTKAAFMSSPHPSPVAAKSLSVALWKVPAVVPGHGVPAGNHSAVRVTSLKEAVPRRKVDVQNTMQSVRGFGIIARNGAIRRLPRSSTVSLPESRNPCRGLRLSHF